MRQRSTPGTTPPLKTCRDIIALLTEFMEDGLARSEAAALEKHLGGCVACSEYLDSLRKTCAAVSRLRCDAIPVEVHDRLRSFLERRPDIVTL